MEMLNRKLYLVVEGRRETLVGDINFEIEYPEYIQVYLYQNFLGVALLTKVKGLEIDAIKYFQTL